MSTARQPTLDYPFAVSIIAGGDLVAGDGFRSRAQAMSYASSHINDALRGKNSYCTDYCDWTITVIALSNDDDGVEVVETILHFYIA